MSRQLSQSTSVIIIAFMYNDVEVYNKVKKSFISKLGSIEIEGDEFDFSHSSYYENEMGVELKKRFVVFSKLRARDYIVRIKKIANRLEATYSKNGNRLINIDPGMLTLENFILSTNKNFTHRIYLKDNIFADLTLIYQKKVGFISLPWTYIDYKEPTTIDFLNNVRSCFKERLAATAPKMTAR